MSTPIPELIALELVSRLEAITTGNGYPFTVPSVDRVGRDGRGWSPKNLAIAVTQPADMRNREHDHEGNPPAEGHDLAFSIHCFVRQSDDTTTPDQTTENALVAAVKKAVAGTSDWYTFGGNAFNAQWGTVSPFLSDEGKHAGATLPLLVMYRISEIDPYTPRL